MKDAGIEIVTRRFEAIFGNGECLKKKNDRRKIEDEGGEKVCALIIMLFCTLLSLMLGGRPNKNLECCLSSFEDP